MRTFVIASSVEEGNQIMKTEYNKDEYCKGHNFKEPRYIQIEKKYDGSHIRYKDNIKSSDKVLAFQQYTGVYISPEIY